MSRRAYISFPISGHDIKAVQRNALQYKEVLEVGLGWQIVNPLTVLACAGCEGGNNLPDHEHTWNEWMRADLREMLQCTEIVMCPGWETSPGARMELFVAISAGLMPHLLTPGRASIVNMTDGSRLIFG